MLLNLIVKVLRVNYSLLRKVGRKILIISDYSDNVDLELCYRLVIANAIKGKGVASNSVCVCGPNLRALTL